MGSSWLLAPIPVVSYHWVVDRLSPTTGDLWDWCKDKGDDRLCGLGQVPTGTGIRSLS